MPLLEVRDLRTWFHTDAGVARAVDGVSFQVDRARWWAWWARAGPGSR